MRVLVSNGPLYRAGDEQRQEEARREAEAAEAADRAALRAMKDPLHALSRSADPSRRFRFGRAAIAFVLVGALALPLLYGLATLVSPPRTSDGHPVMPIGQVMFALVVAPVVGGVAGYFVGRARIRSS